MTREELIERYREKRREVNRKFMLMQSLEFKLNGNRWSHNKGKCVMCAVYDKLNYSGLLNKLHDLGFKESA